MSSPRLLFFVLEQRRWLHEACIFPFERAALWLLQVKSGFLSVSALVGGALDWVASAREHEWRLCVKAFGQDKMHCDRRMAEGRGVRDCSLRGWIGNVFMSC